MNVARELRVLGVDPGSRQAGFAFVRFEGSRLVAVEFGVWRVPPKSPRAEGLARLASLATEWLDTRRPDVAAVEGMFHHRNVRSAFALAEARGTLLSVLGKHSIPVEEYPPASVKQAICGAGNADKSQVRQALIRTVPGIDARLLGGAPADASDALAIAICHQLHSRVPSVSGSR